MRRLFFVLFFVSCFFDGEAQNSPVQIADLHVNLHLLSEAGKKTSRKGRCMAPDSIVLEVTCKVNKTDGCKKVHLYLGTKKDSFDIGKAEALFAHTDTACYVNCSEGIVTKVQNNTLKLLNKFSRQELLKYDYLTLFIEDKKNNRSNILYFTNK